MSDFLKHLSIYHNIGTIEEFEQKVNEQNEKKKKQEEFASYVETLKKSISAGELSHEKYRELITKWVHENNR